MNDISNHHDNEGLEDPSPKKEDQRHSKRRRPTPKEMKNIIAFQKLMNEAKEGAEKYSAQKVAENRTNALNDSLVGRKAVSRLSDDTKEFLVKSLGEVALIMAYFILPIIICTLVVLLIEPLLQLETWITALIDRGSASYADRIVEIEHYQQRTEAFSNKIGNGILAGIGFFLFFFIRRLIKGYWLHQE
ncbi:hypothetical protein [Gracilimonas sp.]|uniref:hypothetical protein n=1 Tax=Gracilimonas sp. TaxID=1974203 RepID=UPI003BAB4892